MQYELWGGSFSDLSNIAYLGIDVLGYITTPGAGACADILAEINGTGCGSVINIFNNGNTPLGTQGANYLKVVGEITDAGWGAIAGDCVPGDVVTTVEKYIPFINCGGDGGGYQMNMYTIPWNQPTGGPFPHYDYIRTFTNNLTTTTTSTHVVTFAELQEEIWSVISSINWWDLLATLLTDLVSGNYVGGAVGDAINLTEGIMGAFSSGDWVKSIGSIVNDVIYLINDLMSGNLIGNNNLTSSLIDTSNVMLGVLAPQVTIYEQSLPGTQISTADSTVSDLVAAHGAGSSGYGIVISSDLPGTIYDWADLITLAEQSGITIDTIVLASDVKEDIIEPVTSGVFSTLLPQLQSLYPPNTPVFSWPTLQFTPPTISPIPIPVTTDPPPSGAPIPTGTHPAVTVNGANSFDVFITSATSHSLYHIAWNGAWGQWENLGGTLIGSPAAVSRAQGVMTVYGVQTDNAVYQKTWQNGRWSDWLNLGGQALGVGACAGSSTREDLFARAKNDALYHKFWNGDTWSSWEKVGGHATAEPCAVATGSKTMTVYTRGADGTIYYISWNGWSWSKWASFSSPTLLAGTGPAVSNKHAGIYYLYATTADNSIVGIANKNGAWDASWKKLIPGVMTSSPGIVIQPSTSPIAVWIPTAGERFHCFARGNDMAVWHINYDNLLDNWSNWETIGGVVW